jgi:hypothetical protein
LIAWLMGVAWAQCVGGPTSNATLQRQVESALFSFVELDDAGFEAYRSQAVQSVFCLEELIHPHLAAEFLRLEGIHAFTQNNEPFASAAFRAARTLEPSHRLPTTLAPPGGPLFNLYAASVNLPVVPWALPQGEGFRSFVNGVPSVTAPNGISIVQLEDLAGTLPFSGVVTRREDLPAPLILQLQQLVAPKPVPVPRPMPVGIDPPPDSMERPPRARRTSLWLAALATGAAGAALYGGAIRNRLRYDIAPTKARRQTTNAMVLGAGGAGAVTVAISIAAIARPKRDR